MTQPRQLSIYTVIERKHTEEHRNTLGRDRRTSQSRGVHDAISRSARSLTASAKALGKGCWVRKVCPANHLTVYTPITKHSHTQIPKHQIHTRVDTDRQRGEVAQKKSAMLEGRLLPPSSRTTCGLGDLNRTRLGQLAHFGSWVDRVNEQSLCVAKPTSPLKTHVI
jgi:hypothetical protein